MTLFLTVVLLLGSSFLANKRYVAPNLNFVNVPDLNKVLISEVSITEDKQLRAVHLILNFKPLSDKFQVVGNTIRAGAPQLAWVNVLVPKLLAREGTIQVKLPFYHAPLEATASKEETASLCLSFKAGIDQFYLKEVRK